MGKLWRQDSRNELTFTAHPGMLLVTTPGAHIMNEMLIVALLSIMSCLLVVAAKQFVTDPALPDVDVQLFH